ncbi:ribosomal protein L13e-domain-containing protein [Sordaria brevicollis]|uniref:60S ribosomal protein L13 n=1 Tax=Sordaria brevicollis TaxID=83679 RepID=A0AAE0PL01_SORBR|nr:ribosomal protein L13e-domain-containing protein [Sordaria brevicollis]
MKVTPLIVPLSDQPAAPNLEIHPLPSENGGVLLRVTPPVSPPSFQETNPNFRHVPCDIVLAIDVSGSMGADAPDPTSANPTRDPSEPWRAPEHNGLTVLDLVKHAARTIASTLTEYDRLGIVTFSSQAKVLQPLLPMTATNQKKTERNLGGMHPSSATNLWGGIVEGLKLFETDESGGGRVPALMVLTDGMPNHMCPAKGYVQKLKAMERLPAAVHTFGFGYSLRSGLLKSIAEIGGGGYSFIPDAGMIGTVFVHSVANLQSTFANNVVLRVTYPRYLGLKETTGESVDKVDAVQLDDRDNELVSEGKKDENDPDSLMQLTLNLSTLQYGQSRDIFLRYDSKAREAIDEGFDFESRPFVHATLDYQHFTTITSIIESKVDDIFRPNPNVKPLTPAQIAYHISRSALISFLSSIYPIRKHDGEHQARSYERNLATTLESLLSTLPAAQPAFASDPHCRSLVQDLIGCSSSVTDAKDHQDGQVALALTNMDFYNRWGIHYLPSLASAHERQMCNSFKDPGPLMYGANSPLFIKCRDRLDAAFDSLPAPKPSRDTGYRGEISMASYNSSFNPCFAGETRVVVACGNQLGTKEIQISELRKGMMVQTPKGLREVRAVLKTPVEDEKMCLVSAENGGKSLLVTPWHPISLDGKNWAFPIKIAHGDTVSYTGDIYSVLLERDTVVDAHAIMVEGVWGVTLGHGLTGTGEGVVVTGEEDDVRSHRFFGDYDLVVQSLAELPWSQDGLVLGGDFRKDWQRRVRCHFDQAGKKASRRVARQAKAAALAPRPVDKLRPIVRCPTVKYNRRTRLGRGFSLAELKAAGIPKLLAPTIGIAVDPRRANLSEESLAANVERLKAYKARLVVFPRKSNKPKKADTPKDQQAGETIKSVAAAFGVESPVASGFKEINKSELPSNVEGGAFRALRKARSDAKLVGVREKRAKDKAAAEAEKSK